MLAVHPAVEDVAVIGVPHPEYGEEVKGVVQLGAGQVASDALAAELISYCQSQLARYKCPRSVDFVESLPRMPNGKLLKRELRAQYCEMRKSVSDRAQPGRRIAMFDVSGTPHRAVGRRSYLLIRKVPYAATLKVWSRTSFRARRYWFALAGNPHRVLSFIVSDPPGDLVVEFPKCIAKQRAGSPVIDWRGMGSEALPAGAPQWIN